MSRCPKSVLLLCISIGLSIARADPARAVIEIVNLDGPGEGFNDPAPAAPVGGNSGTTIGQQRLFVFRRAAALWDAELRSPVTIRVAANFDSLFCSATQAILGSAGPEAVERDFPNAPSAATWYAVAEANAVAGQDLDPGSVDMSATFNSQIGTVPGCGFRWYYGVDGNSGGDIALLSVVLHEFAHGLGFLPFFDRTTGEKFFGFDDAFLLNLLDASTNQLLRSMSNAQRAAACVKPEQLHWIGPAVTAEGAKLTSGVGPAGRVHMYSPNALLLGSSVAHFSTSLTPSELMEPSYVGPTQDLGLTRALLTDIGWSEQGATGDCVASSTTLCLLGGRFAATLRWADGGAAGLRDALVATPRTSGAASSAGLFYFYGSDPSNWELLVKMVDGCRTNGASWVLVSGSTGFQWQLTITDVATGATRVYAHPLDGKASGIADFDAFTKCP